MKCCDHKFYHKRENWTCITKLMVKSYDSIKKWSDNGRTTFVLSVAAQLSFVDGSSFTSQLEHSFHLPVATQLLFVNDSTASIVNGSMNESCAATGRIVHDNTISFLKAFEKQSPEVGAYEPISSVPSFSLWNYQTNLLIDFHIHTWHEYLQLNSLWPSDVIWWHRSGSTSAQVMACCLMAFI